MTTTERSAEIRKALKAKGWSSRQVSVVSDLYSMGSSIRIKIKDATVPLSAVKAIATPHEHVRWDEASGEILSGGNRFVTIDYTAEALAALAAPYRAPVEAALAKLPEGDTSRLEPVAGTPFLIGRGRHGNHVSLWGKGGFIAEYYDANGAAERIGQKMLEAPA
jgi:hypothetical protein